METEQKPEDTNIKEQKLKTPFSNELVLENIFGRLSNINDLLSCRLVCIQWAILGSKILKTRHRPLITVNIVGQYEDKVPFRIHDILKLKESSLSFPTLKDHFPYNRFLLGEYALDLGVAYINKFFHLLTPILHLSFSPETLNNTQISTFREILIFHLPECESLELIFPRYGYLEFPYLFPPKLFTLVNPVLPNITQLILKLPTDRTEFTPQFFKDLFRAVPNLVTLKMFDVHGSIFDFLLSKEMLLEDIPLLKLRHLELQFTREGREEIRQPHFEKLGGLLNKYLKLQTLTLSSMTDNIELRCQKEFIAALAGSLEKLTISKFSYFESLSPLENIGIYFKYFETKSLSELPPIDFVFESLPKLRTLVLGKVTSELFKLGSLVPTLIIEAYPTHNLENLALPKGLVDCMAIPKVLDGFQNLRKLELTCDDKTLKSIYKCGRDGKLKNLKELSIFDDSFVTDEGITGIPLQHCRDLYKKQCELSAGIDSIENLRGQECWIADLQGLRAFELSEVEEKGVPKNRISDVSILFGFRYLKELNNLTIPKTWVTNSALSYIAKYYCTSLIFLDISLCYYVTPPAVEELKEQKPDLQIKCKNWYKNLVSKFNRCESMTIPSSSYFMAF